MEMERLMKETVEGWQEMEGKVKVLCGVITLVVIYYIVYEHNVHLNYELYEALLFATMQCISARNHAVHISS